MAFQPYSPITVSRTGNLQLRRMNFSQVEVRGLAELEQTLLGLGKALATEAGQEAMLATADTVKQVMEVAAPSGEGEGTTKTWAKGTGRRVKTDVQTMRAWGMRRYGTTFKEWTRSSRNYGKLRDNIVAKLIFADKPQQVKVAVGTGSAFWGLFKERGTARRSTGKHGGVKANRGVMPADPWMAPAFFQMMPAILQTLAAQINHSINRTVTTDRMRRGIRK